LLVLKKLHFKICHRLRWLPLFCAPFSNNLLFNNWEN